MERASLTALGPRASPLPLTSTPAVAQHEFLRAEISVVHPGCFSQQIKDGMLGRQLSVDLHAELFVLRGKPAQIEAFWNWVIAHAEQPPEIISRTSELLVLRGRSVRRGVVDEIHNHGCSILWPAHFLDGTERYTVLAPSRTALERMVQDLRRIAQVTVTRIALVRPERLDPAVSRAELTSRLTRRQLAILRAAVEAGYYDLPRRTSAVEIAARFGISKSTVAEHLRKAEAALLEKVTAAVVEGMVDNEDSFRGVGRPMKASRGAEPKRRLRLRGPQ